MPLSSHRQFEAALAFAAESVDRTMDRLLPSGDEGEARLFEAMRYSSLGSVKRLRASATRLATPGMCATKSGPKADSANSKAISRAIRAIPVPVFDLKYATAASAVQLSVLTHNLVRTLRQ